MKCWPRLKQSLTAIALMVGMVSCAPGASLPGQLSSDTAVGRTPRSLQKVFVRNRDSFHYLYNAALRQDPDLRGDLVLSISVGPDGRVTECHAVSTDLKDKAFVYAVIAKVKRLNFGKAAGPSYTYSHYPMHFVPEF